MHGHHWGIGTAVPHSRCLRFALQKQSIISSPVATHCSRPFPRRPPVRRKIEEPPVRSSRVRVHRAGINYCRRPHWQRSIILRTSRGEALTSAWCDYYSFAPYVAAVVATAAVAAIAPVNGTEGVRRGMNSTRRRSRAALCATRWWWWPLITWRRGAGSADVVRTIRGTQ